LQDLESYLAVWRKPLTGTYRGYGVISMPPPSSGGIALIQLLKMVEPFPLGKYGWQSPKAIHVMTEAERRVYADRAAHLGDTDFYPVPIEGLIDEGYLKERMKTFDPQKASLTADISEGKPAPHEHNETTHFSIVDAAGNAISVTTTINGGYGSHVVVGGAGFLLNNEMDDFSAKPGVPNYFGLVGTEANAIQPHKRMLSSMTPTILTKDNKLFMVVGSPGGSKIITSVFQAIVNVIDHGMTMQGAVSVPRFHHQWKPEWVYYEENGFSPKLIKKLKKLGHEPQAIDKYSRIDAILILPDGRMEGGADPRGDDDAMGY
jgi:gamma-glutamyltranspeptidase/glutathione hydrolase